MKKLFTPNSIIPAALLSALIYLLAASPVMAMPTFIDDAYLNVKFRNEYRNAERPSAADGVYGPKIDAWIQGFLVDFESGQLFDSISVEAGLYHIEKLSADPDKATRFYLNGHEGFTLSYASLNLDFGDYAKFKIGQFGNDYLYGSLDYHIPLINYSSVRTVPSLQEGVFYEGTFNNFHLYGMYSQRYAGGYYQEWTDEGRTTGLTLAPTGDKFIFEIDKKPTYYLAGVWDNKKSLLSLGASYQGDMSWQLMTRGSHSWVNPELGYFKAEFIGFYAKPTGVSKNLNLDNDTFAISAQLLWNKDKVSVLGSAGQVGRKLSANSDIDTDVGFSFDQSIDRNHNDMFAWQLGGFYQLTLALQTGLAFVVTDGYEDRNHKVNIEGLGANLLLNYTLQDGPLKGLKTSLILNKAQEYRKGSRLGDKLDYYDIKFTVHHDFKLL